VTTLAAPVFPAGIRRFVLQWFGTACVILLPWLEPQTNRKDMIVPVYASIALTLAASNPLAALFSSCVSSP
jgi:hypothetical protein